jgi:hypothetical protein
MCPLGLYFNLGISLSVSATLETLLKRPPILWRHAFPKESPIPIRYCSNGLQELLDSFPIMFQLKFGHFLYISLETPCFCIIRLKIEDATEKFKNHQPFSPSCDLFNHTSYCQTQISATVPLTFFGDNILVFLSKVF